MTYSGAFKVKAIVFISMFVHINVYMQIVACNVNIINVHNFVHLIFTPTMLYKNVLRPNKKNYLFLKQFSPQIDEEMRNFLLLKGRVPSKNLKNHLYSKMNVWVMNNMYRFCKNL